MEAPIPIGKLADNFVTTEVSATITVTRSHLLQGIKDLGITRNSVQNRVRLQDWLNKQITSLNYITFKGQGFRTDMVFPKGATGRLRTWVADIMREQFGEGN